MHKKLALLLFFIGFLFVSSSVLAEEVKKLSIENIRYGAVVDGVRIVFDLGAKPDYRAFVLDNPNRIVIDLPNVVWKHAKSGLLSDNRIIKGFRSGTLDNGVTRIVFDTKDTAVIKTIFTLVKDSSGPDRLVVDVEKASPNRLTAERDKIFGSKNLKADQASVKDMSSSLKLGDTAAKPQSELALINNKKIAAENPAPQSSDLIAANKPAKKPQPQVLTPMVNKPAEPVKHVVVIDAGHGGADPGATLNGIMEKNVTLQVARELKRAMDETGHFKVILTRDSDIYIKLGDRRDVARKVKAELFISLHADSIERKTVSGASLYTLSEKSSDAETERLAESENNSGFVAGVDLGHESQEVADILIDLAMRDKMNESSLFAKYLRSALEQGSVNLLESPSRSAGFAVLKAPDVPAVLMEMGYLSNPQDSKLLTTSTYQRKLANSILNGVDLYFRKIESLQK